MKLKKYLFCIAILLSIENLAQGNGKNKLDRPQDSVWYFYPFSVDVGAGLWVPSGNLASYYNPNLQVSFYIGIMITQKMRAQIGGQIRGMNQTRPLLLKANDTILPYQRNALQGGFGAWISYTLYQNRWLCTELIGGVANQSIGTIVENKATGDSILIRGTGLSIGAHTWFHTYKGLNFGLRAEYNYVNYDQSNFLAKNMGTNYFNLSLIYRIQPMENRYKKWYR